MIVSIVTITNYNNYNNYNHYPPLKRNTMRSKNSLQPTVLGF